MRLNQHKYGFTNLASELGGWLAACPTDGDGEGWTNEIYTRFADALQTTLAKKEEEAEEKAKEAAERLSGKYADPYALSCYADLLFTLRGLSNSEHPRRSGYYVDQQEYEVDLACIIRAKDVFNTFTCGLATFPIPESRFDELVSFIEHYLLISRYFAYGDTDRNDPNKQKVFDECAAAANAFASSIALWIQAFKSMNMAIELDVDHKNLFDVARPFNPQSLQDLGKLIGADRLVAAHLTNKVPMSDIILDHDLASNTKNH